MIKVLSTKGYSDYMSAACLEVQGTWKLTDSSAVAEPISRWSSSSFWLGSIGSTCFFLAMASGPLADVSSLSHRSLSEPEYGC